MRKHYKANYGRLTLLCLVGMGLAAIVANCIIVPVLKNFGL